MPESPKRSKAPGTQLLAVAAWDFYTAANLDVPQLNDDAVAYAAALRFVRGYKRTYLGRLVGACGTLLAEKSPLEWLEDFPQVEPRAPQDIQFYLAVYVLVGYLRELMGLDVCFPDVRPATPGSIYFGRYRRNTSKLPLDKGLRAQGWNKLNYTVDLWGNKAEGTVEVVYTRSDRIGRMVVSRGPIPNPQFKPKDPHVAEAFRRLDRLIASRA